MKLPNLSIVVKCLQNPKAFAYFAFICLLLQIIT